ncbi:RNA polymerase sigma factor [Variovorax sp. OV329]|uniref:RNA polymerase sigma factor n=1 Tax=Variovorax sp. OV329 TaxID=1882825 RepID=UPI0008E18A7B|nr:RNA polymerase sigma factor [Variovorax sp. OV329]SFN08053.1 RNA polymerase, sigma subunit, ECF family [Variovorax sp. OV329]
MSGGANDKAEEAARRAIAGVWPIESARITAVVARMVRDVGVAEELAQDALVSALQQWPHEGLPDNPAAWLTAAAKHRALDWLRRSQMMERKHEEIAHTIEALGGEPLAPAPDEGADEDIEDDLLRLIFTACHPVLAREARVALALRVLCGLATDEIARAFLVPEPTIAQRIVRAKRSLRDAKVPFEVPRAEALAPRLASVLEVVYLVFNEGYSATAGEHWMRTDLCAQALRLGRVLAELVPQAPEVHGLVALMEIQASRSAARTDRQGAPILLMDQDRSRWDQLLIRRGLAALERADGLGGARGPYALQAAIAACHARALRAGDTDWARIASLYAALAVVEPSPVVDLNRAVAVSRAEGAAAALPLVDALVAEGALKSYHLLPAVRGDLLQSLGRLDEARLAFEQAAALTRNERERALLRARAQACIGPQGEG